jgi:hypothetical protein
MTKMLRFIWKPGNGQQISADSTDGIDSHPIRIHVLCREQKLSLDQTGIIRAELVVYLLGVLTDDAANLPPDGDTHEHDVIQKWLSYGVGGVYDFPHMAAVIECQNWTQAAKRMRSASIRERRVRAVEAWQQTNFIR